MIWQSAAEFWAMGGYGVYVWGSMGVSAALLALEVLLARVGRRQALDAVCEAIRQETGIETVLSTTGGTSDGRFIAKICPQVIELGPTNATIHKINEYLPVADIEPLKNIYRRVLENLDAGLTL